MSFFGLLFWVGIWILLAIVLEWLGADEQIAQWIMRG